MKKEKKIYIIPVSYTVSGLVSVEAVDEDDAIEAALEYIDEMPLPTDTEYVEASYEVESDPDMVTTYTEMYEKGELGNTGVTASGVISEKAKMLGQK